MEWTQMEYFLTVARTQHMTRAAEELNMTQPALSHSIAKLEEELGVQLFERSGRSLQLNRYGSLFADRVERALREIRKGREEIEELIHPQNGTIALGFLNILGSYVVPDIIRHFQEKHPGMRFDLYQGNQLYVNEMLESGKCDMVITSPRTGLGGMGWQPLFARKLKVVVPAGHPLAGTKDISLQELKDEPFIENKLNCGLKKMMDGLFHDAGFRPQSRYEAEDLQTVAGFVSMGLGISILPDSLGLRLNGISWIDLRDSGCEYVVGLEWKEKRYLSPASRLFREFVVSKRV